MVAAAAAASGIMGAAAASGIMGAAAAAASAAAVGEVAATATSGVERAVALAAALLVDWRWGELSPTAGTVAGRALFLVLVGMADV
jgi:hypothetical protein